MSIWTDRVRLAGEILRRRLASLGSRGLFYIVEDLDWVIKREGEYLLRHLAPIAPQLKGRLEASPRGLRGQLLHFGSLGAFAGAVDYAHADNRLVATCYHGYPEMGGAMRRNLEKLIKEQDRLDRVVTACGIMQERLTGWGIPREKLRLIPLGASRRDFYPLPPAERQKLRAKLGIPADAVCIGSFQKDGEGWGEGDKPKLIKGPDLFVEVVAELAKRRRVFALLTGPARGFVIKGLQKAGVGYVHLYPKELGELCALYNCLDLYLITAREEGGPKSLPEGMAAGVPLVTTRVGMAPDMIQSGMNGIMTELDDLEGLVQGCLRIMEDAGLRESVVERGFETVKRHDWPVLAQAHWRELYEPLLAELRGESREP